MNMIGKVRRMKLRDKLSNSAIAKLTGLSRNTVKKWLNAPGDIAPKYRRESAEDKLTAFAATLEQALTADAHRPKHGRRTAKVLFASTSEAASLRSVCWASRRARRPAHGLPNV